jgi:hypothetical protein
VVTVYFYWRNIMDVKYIKFVIDPGKEVVLKFVLEHDEWVCRATTEYIDDLVNLTDMTKEYM